MSKFLFEAVAFSDNHKESAVKKMIYAGIIFLSIFMIGYWYDIRALQKELITERNSHQQLQQQIDQLTQQTAAFNQQRSDLLQLQKQSNDLHQQISTDTDNQSIINTILQAGQSAGIQFNSIKPQTLNKQSFYSILPIEITITGNYPQLINFMNLLSQMKTLMTIPEFNLSHANAALSTAMDSTPTNADKLVMSMTINVYILS